MTVPVPRALGGTLLLTLAPPPSPELTIVTARSRDGQVKAISRDGSITGKGR